MLSLLRSVVQYSVSNPTSFHRAYFWLQEYMMGQEEYLARFKANFPMNLFTETNQLHKLLTMYTPALVQYQNIFDFIPHPLKVTVQAN